MLLLRVIGTNHTALWECLFCKCRNDHSTDTCSSCIRGRCPGEIKVRTVFFRRTLMTSLMFPNCATRKKCNKNVNYDDLITGVDICYGCANGFIADGYSHEDLDTLGIAYELEVFVEFDHYSKEDIVTRKDPDNRVFEFLLES